MESCVMLQLSMWTGIDLSAVFKEEDLVEPGIERDSHITVAYSADQEIPRDEIGEVIDVLLKPDNLYWKNRLKEQEKLKVIDFFELGKFENESDFLVLKLREDSDIYQTLKVLNTGICSKYGIKSEYKDYTPHVTLAKLEPGKAKDYMFSGTLGLVLETALFSLDDFVISYDHDKSYQITSINSIDRYFRQRELNRYIID